MVQYDKVLVKIAELEPIFYKKINIGYLKIIELEHLYESLIKGLRASEFDEPFPHTITHSGFLSYGLNELENIHKELNHLYFYCTKKKLEKSRLR